MKEKHSHSTDESVTKSFIRACLKLFFQDLFPQQPELVIYTLAELAEANIRTTAGVNEQRQLLHALQPLLTASSQRTELILSLDQFHFHINRGLSLFDLDYSGHDAQAKAVFWRYKAEKL